MHLLIPNLFITPLNTHIPLQLYMLWFSPQAFREDFEIMESTDATDVVKEKVTKNKFIWKDALALTFRTGNIVKQIVPLVSVCTVL